MFPKVCTCYEKFSLGVFIKTSWTENFQVRPGILYQQVCIGVYRCEESELLHKSMNDKKFKVMFLWHPCKHYICQAHTIGG